MKNILLTLTALLLCTGLSAQKYKGEMDIQVSEETDCKRFLLTVMLYEKENGGAD